MNPVLPLHDPGNSEQCQPDHHQRMRAWDENSKHEKHHAQAIHNSGKRVTRLHRLLYRNVVHNASLLTASESHSSGKPGSKVYQQNAMTFVIRFTLPCVCSRQRLVWLISLTRSTRSMAWPIPAASLRHSFAAGICPFFAFAPEAEPRACWPKVISPRWSFPAARCP